MKTAPDDLPTAAGLRVVLLASAFNKAVVDGLVGGARMALRDMGAAAEDVELVVVPGAFELPLAARAAAISGRFDAIVALGAVIRGETDHYEHVAREAASGLQTVAHETGVPIGFGVLTVEQEDQARARSAPGRDNKGAEAARAAVAMVAVLRSLTRSSGPGAQSGRPARSRPRAASRRPGGRR